MNPSPSLLERLSPRPMVCPLVHLGRPSPTNDQDINPSTSDHSYHHDGFHLNYQSQQQMYMDIYTEVKNESDQRFTNKQQSMDNYLSQNSYHAHTYMNNKDPTPESRFSPCNRTVHGQKKKYSKQPLDLSSLSLGPSYWDHELYTNNSELSQSPEYYRNINSLPSLTQPVLETNYLVDNFSKLGKASPSLDQGYHTLVSPSPGPATPNPWTESGNIFKGKKTTTKANSLDRLSDDLILRIFSWLQSSDLSVCARVCRRFALLVWQPSLWRSICLKGEEFSGDKAIRGVLRQLCGQGRTGACPSVERVQFSDGTHVTDRGLLLLARRCPELTHLQVQGSAGVTNHTLYELVSRCNNLQHLDITGCIQISCIGSFTGVETQRRLQLQYLDLTDCSALQDNGLRVIVRNCPQLAYLYLRRCTQITDAGLKFVPSFCSGLRELSVSDCSGVTDFGLYELAKLGATLRYLSVAKCDQVSDAGLKVVARRCYKLRYLNCRGCEAVSDDAITVLARSCTRLRALDIGKCDVSDAGLRALAESCPNIKKLSLRNCDLVTDRGVQCIAYFCRGLQQLNIQDCQISLEGYRAVKKYCKRCVIEHTNPGFF